MYNLENATGYLFGGAVYASGSEYLTYRALRRGQPTLTFGRYMRCAGHSFPTIMLGSAVIVGIVHRASPNSRGLTRA